MRRCITAGKSYAIRIDSGATKDTANNFFAGISDDTTWNFTTAGIGLFDDFATDPNLTTQWTEYGYYTTTDLGTALWNSTDQDLDLAKSAGNSLRGLYRTGSTRSATDSVTLAVKALGRTSGTWGFVGLMITAASQQDYLTGPADSYTLAMAPQSATTFRYEVRRTYVDGTGNYQLYTGPTITFAGPYTLDIVRNGDHYDFNPKSEVGRKESKEAHSGTTSLVGSEPCQVYFRRPSPTAFSLCSLRSLWQFNFGIRVQGHRCHAVFDKHARFRRHLQYRQHGLDGILPDCVWRGRRHDRHSGQLRRVQARNHPANAGRQRHRR